MSKIEWTDQTWNPVVGCTPVSPGCLNCYAATMAPRLAAMGQTQYVGLTVRNTVHSVKAVVPGTSPDARGVRHVFNGTVRCLEDRLTAPLHWKRPRMVFVNSMSDLFHEDVPFEFIDRVFAVMALTPQHTYQVLTKRPERMAEYLNTPRRDLSIIANTVCFERPPGWAEAVVHWPHPNVWIGTSCEDQKRADDRIPHLLRCPAAVRFLSCEPLLGHINLSRYLWTLYGDRRHGRLNQLHWVIVGGESGANARPCRVPYVRDIVADCKDAEVPCFVKQLGARPWFPYYNDDDQERERCLDREHAVYQPVAGLHDNRRDGYARWHSPERDGQPSTGTQIEVKLGGKGGDPVEWPMDLRVREFPAALSPAPTGA